MTAACRSHVPPAPMFVATSHPPLPRPLQVRINALLGGSLPAGALQATACTVESLWPPFVDGAWEVHPAVVQLAAPDVPCTLQVPPDALAGAQGLYRDVHMPAAIHIGYT